MLVLGLEVLLLLLARRERFPAGALLAGLVQQRLLRLRELVLLGGHERIEVRLRLVLSLGRRKEVVLEGLEHILEDVLDAARPRLVLLLESRLPVQLLPVRGRHIEDFVELAHVVLREEAPADLEHLLELRDSPTQRPLWATVSQRLPLATG